MAHEFIPNEWFILERLQDVLDLIRHIQIPASDKKRVFIQWSDEVGHRYTHAQFLYIGADRQ